jgi:hypothetical protein
MRRLSPLAVLPRHVIDTDLRVLLPKRACH